MTPSLPLQGSRSSRGSKASMIAKLEADKKKREADVERSRARLARFMEVAGGVRCRAFHPCGCWDAADLAIDMAQTSNVKQDTFELLSAVAPPSPCPRLTRPVFQEKDPATESSAESAALVNPNAPPSVLPGLRGAVNRVRPALKWTPVPPTGSGGTRLSSLSKARCAQDSLLAPSPLGRKDAEGGGLDGNMPKVEG